MDTEDAAGVDELPASYRSISGRPHVFVMIRLISGSDFKTYYGAVVIRTACYSCKIR